MVKHSVEIETGECVELNIEKHCSEMTIVDHDEIDDDVIGRHASLLGDSRTILLKTYDVNKA